VLKLTTDMHSTITIQKRYPLRHSVPSMLYLGYVFLLRYKKHNICTEHIFISCTV